MRKYYTRACNFYYGNTAKDLILNKKALSLNSRKDIAFDQIEIFQRKKNHVVECKFYSISEIKKLNRKRQQITHLSPMKNTQDYLKKKK